MRSIVFIILLFLFVFNSSAQDLIITTTGDSVSCKIIEEKGSFIFYNALGNGRVEKRAINKQAVSDIKLNYYKFNVIDNYVPLERKESPFRISFGAGYGKIHNYAKPYIPQLNDHYKKMENGLNLNFDIGYWLRTQIGLGLQYSLFRSSNQSKITLATIYPYYQTSNEVVNDAITIHSVSPTFYFKPGLFPNNKNVLMYTGSAGISFFNNTANAGERTGRNISATLGTIYERKISSYAYLGFVLKYTFLYIDKYTLKSGNNTREYKLTSSQYIQLNRIDLGLCVSIR